MSIRKCLSMSSAALGLAAGLGVFALANAQAAYVVFNPDADFSMMPYTVSLAGGSATFTFTDISGMSIDSSTVDAVSTGGNGEVNSFIDPISYTSGTLIGDNGYPAFTPFPTSAGIQYSASLTSIGVEFSQSDGVHYGFVTVHGPEVLQYGFNSTPGGSIPTGVPEPATWVMLITGVATLGAVASIKRIRTPHPA